MTSGTASDAISLTVGSNTVNVKVTAEDGTTTATYAVTVTRPSTVTTLSALTGSTSTDGSTFAGTLTLSPSFASATTTYTATVPNTVTHLKVTPTVTTGSGATVEAGLGSSLSSVASGTASDAISLTVGSNTVNVKVTAQDGTTTATYTITLTRLAGVTVSETTRTVTGTGSTTYTVKLNTQPTATVTLTPTSAATGTATVATDSNDNLLTFTSTNWNTAQTVTVTGVTAGATSVTHTVTSSSDTKYPTSLTIPSVAVTVNAAAGLDLSVMSGTVNAAGTFTYSVTLATSPTAQVIVTPTSADPSVATVSGARTFASGQGSVAQTFTVTGAAAGATSITHNASSSDTAYALTGAAAVSVSVRGVVFSASSVTATGTGTVTYTARLATAPTDTVTVTPTSTSGAIATVSPTTGRSFTSTNYSTPQTFTVTGVTEGSTSITHAATSTSDANYQITAAGSVAVTVNADLTNVATLSSLTGTTSADGSTFSGAVALIPVFASATTAYTASVPNTVTHVRFTPTATAGSGATVEVGLGSSLSTVASGSASSALALTVGVNTVNVKVTAADGTTTQTYAVTLTRRTVLPANSVRMVSATPGDGTVAAVWEMASGVCFVNLRYRVVDTDTNQSGDQPGPWRSHSADSSTGNTCDATTSVTTPASDAPQLYNGHLYEIQVLGKLTGTTTETAWSASVQFTPAAAVSASLALSALSVASSDVSEIYDNTLVLNPAFAADTVYYVANDLAGTETSVQVTPTVATSGSTVKVGFKGATLTAATSGSASTLVLPVGYSVIAVEVTDTDNNTATYQIAVLRLAVPANTTATSAALNGTPALTFGSDAAGRSGYEVSWQVKDASETWGERTTELDVSSSVITGSAATVSGNTVGGFVPGATVHVRMHFTDSAGRPHWSRFGTGTPIQASSEPITVTLWNVPGKPTSVKAVGHHRQRRRPHPGMGRAHQHRRRRRRHHRLQSSLACQRHQPQPGRRPSRRLEQQRRGGHSQRNPSARRRQPLDRHRL